MDERREFFRVNYSSPLKFKSLSVRPNEPGNGSAENISPCGILFQTSQNPPHVASILWMDLDLRTLRICQEIESRALIFNNGVVGKVVRVEQDSAQNNTFDVGVCFLTKSQSESREVQEILSQVSRQG